ncbi:phosphoribosylamine-glycine ligase [Tieghemostelium lacteum]|uniref:Phosphoribosylamine-glycine ligase n=1 Tax=Tieghemostelium lacteum TaxID=361077 RepID=A0A152A0T5_TIELA|nr:phosphoribosylamine-glycine ligase [Tieghemostelium lacteum]|eukprot:KYQ99857.1 phosphoribosylamine-glycine ligase [Tieghemostelium lacteum]
MKHNICVIGSGGREHAIAWKLLQSQHVDKVIMIPGNDILQNRDRIVNVKLDKLDGPLVANVCRQYNIELVFVGPEVPLCEGISDSLKKQGISCFGPSEKAAVIEGSKAFSKDFMVRHQIPTAKYKNFTDYLEACKYIENEVDYQMVIKASGVAAGKGVLIPQDKKEALEALKRIMVVKEFGSAGQEVVIEEFIEGEECSLMCFSDGHSLQVMPPAQDHKRIFDLDQGPNTGGMGAYAPAPFVIGHQGSPRGKHGFGALIDRAIETVLQPAIDGMRKEGRPFVGVLFAGLMISRQQQIKVLEFNCRMGDPETQVILPLLESDLYEVVCACVEGRLDSIPTLKWRQEYCVTIVAASKGYPDVYPKGLPIKGIEECNSVSGITVFQAGTSLASDMKTMNTSGGRVLAVTCIDKSLETAILSAYKSIQLIQFDGMQYRRDIGQKALNYLNSQEKVQSVSYSESGVDMERGDQVVDNIVPMAKSTNRLGCMADLGGFGALFDCKAAGFKDPILVSGTDGVGTKLKIAQELDIHGTIGIDLVAMCVNDVVVQGAEPLFFLDYFATGKIHVNVATQVISGIAKGCKESGCALIGGETAEMPGMYKDGEYDLAGFSVGAVERDKLLPLLNEFKEGDVLLGIASSGVHSNGYSLVRYLVEKKSGLKYTDKCPWDSSKTIGQSLLTPTKLYVLSCLAAIKAGGVRALAHITGGGITENLPRVFPNGYQAEIKFGSWTIPPVIQWLNSLGNMKQEELLRTFNCGIGMILVIDPTQLDTVKSILESHNETVYTIGRVTKSSNSNEKPKVVYI